jgi:peptidoglycan/LPS O-acetylase OafA/YrhL
MSENALVRPVPRNLFGLQAGRAIAALLVVLFHNSQSIFALTKYWNEKPFGNVFDFGDSGVMFFFVLSGFIIFHAHYNDLGHPTRILDYTWKRIRRIYPVYWVILALTLPIYFLNPQLGEGYETHLGIILTSIALVHFDSLDVVIPVSWTLFHEVLFYVLFAVALWRPRVGFSVMAVWLLLSGLDLMPHHSTLLVDFYFSNMHLLFGFGMAAAWWVRRARVKWPVLVTLCGIVIFLSAGIERNEWNVVAVGWRAIVYGIGATLAVMGAVELEREGRLRVPAWLRLVGDASYSIYLVHFLALSFLAKAVWKLGLAHAVPTKISFILLAVMATAMGVVWHIAVERPLLSFFGRRKSTGLQAGSSPNTIS